MLRVSTIYELRTLTGPLYPSWIGIPDAGNDLLRRAQLLPDLIPFRNER